MIKAVLLDADGVIQAAVPDFVSQLQNFVPENGEAFAQDLFAAEQPAATGDARFVDILETVLNRWQVQLPINEVLELWRRIDVIQGLPELARDIRSAGAKVALATNQQDDRMEFMTQTLNYGEYFDCCFYSCALGAKKPSAAFFEKALLELRLPAEQCLFVDDSLVNVEGARKAGLRAELFQFESIETGADELRALLKAHLPNQT